MARITESLEFERQIPISDRMALGRACRSRIPDALRKGELIPCRGCDKLIRRTREQALLNPCPDLYCDSCLHVGASVRQERRTTLELVESQIKGLAAQGFLEELQEEGLMPTSDELCVVCGRLLLNPKGRRITCNPQCTRERENLLQRKHREAARKNKPNATQ